MILPYEGERLLRARRAIEVTSRDSALLPLSCRFPKVSGTRALKGLLRSRSAKRQDDRFAYVPADAMIPGILAAGDIVDVIANLPARRVLLEEAVDGKDRVVPEAELGAELDALCWRYHTARERIAVVRNAVEALAGDAIRQR